MGISVHPITQEVYISTNGAGFYGYIRGWNRASQTVRTVVSLGPYSYTAYLDFMSDGTLFIAANGVSMYSSGLNLINFYCNPI